MSKIDITNKFFYEWGEPDLKERTKARLIEIDELGMEEIGLAEFGIPGVTSGLFIERIWWYSDEGFNSHIDYVKKLIKSNQ